jgi:hypothetical protein
MNSTWSNAAGWVLMMAAVALLAFLRRLDLLVVVAPVSLVFAYRLARGRFRIRTLQR